MTAESVFKDGTIRGTSPRDGSPLPAVACTPPSVVRPMVERARRAGEVHAARDIEERARLLGRFKDALLARGDALVEALSLECGKPEAESWLHEVVPIADLAEFWGGEGVELLAPHAPELSSTSYPGKHARVERVARGVIALISPWNFPVAIPLRTLFPALLAGDAVVFKPSEYTPRCAVVIGEAAAEVYGPHLVQVAQGGGDVGAALVGGGVDAVVFTGSVATGRLVAHGAADALIPVGLELGGKDAAIVLEDADIERTARGLLWGAMANAGQNCAAIERVYVCSGVALALRQRLEALAAEMVPGRDFGPVTTDAQLRIIERHVQGARYAGAAVLAGGARLNRPGRWYAPTVLADVPRGDPSLTEETFGPVLPLVEVADEDEAVAAANASPFGLTASVWTRDLRRGERVARRLRAGTVVVNNHGFTGSVPSLPWSGTGASGYGVTSSEYALDVLTRPRAVVVDTRRAKAEMWWHPYTPALAKMGRSLATLRGGAPVGAKLAAVRDLVGAARRRWKA